MATGFPDRDYRGIFRTAAGPAGQLPYQNLTDVPLQAGLGGLLKRPLIDLQQQHQIQHPMFIRSVKQRTHLASSSSLSSNSMVDLETEHKSTIRTRLQELERQLLDDDDDDENEATASGSTITAAYWGQTMKQIISSPTTSSSSSSSSTASSSPGSTTPLKQLLLDTATAVSDGNMETAIANLTALKRVQNPNGDPEQRLTAIMAAALISRISHPIADLSIAETHASTQLLFDLCPCFKLALLAANLAILESTRDAPKIHILDFNIREGGQHAALIHALADRHRRLGGIPPAVKITAVCDPNGEINSLRSIGERIARLGDRLGVALRFSIVRKQVVDLDPETLGCEPGEALAVNLAFHLSKVADESVSPANPRDDLLRRVRALGPRVVVLVEEEVNGNTAPFMARFIEACGHYGAILETLDATAARERIDRRRVEAGLAGRAANLVAREGAGRVERSELFGKWRARMGMAGLRPVELGPGVCEPVRARVGSLRNNPGFVVREEGGGICFGWMGRVLTVASAWR